MKEILQSLTSPTWWFSVVLVGVIINMVSAYLKPTTDAIWARYSSIRRSKQEEGQKKRKEYIEYLRSNPQEQLFCAFREMRHRYRAQLMLVQATFMFIVPVTALQHLSATEKELVEGFIIGFFASSAIVMLAVTRHVGRAAFLRDVLKEARNSPYDD